MRKTDSRIGESQRQKKSNPERQTDPERARVRERWSREIDKP